MYVDIESNLELVGATAVEDNLQDEVPETIGACDRTYAFVEVLGLCCVCAPLFCAVPSVCCVDVHCGITAAVHVSG